MRRPDLRQRDGGQASTALRFAQDDSGRAVGGRDHVNGDKGTGF
jgi:hypothetical protein